MRAFTLIALFGIAAAIKIAQEPDEVEGGEVDDVDDTDAKPDEGTTGDDGDESTGDDGDDGSEGEGSGDEDGDEETEVVDLTHEDIARGLFDIYDQDNDGYMTYEELDQVFYDMSSTLREHGRWVVTDDWMSSTKDHGDTIDLFDVNFDGKVSEDEFVDELDTFMEENQITDYDLGLFLIGLSDEDQSYTVTPDELIDMFASFGVEVS